MWVLHGPEACSEGAGRRCHQPFLQLLVGVHSSLLIVAPASGPSPATNRSIHLRPRAAGCGACSWATAQHLVALGFEVLKGSIVGG